MELESCSERAVLLFPQAVRKGGNDWQEANEQDKNKSVGRAQQGYSDAALPETAEGEEQPDAKGDGSTVL